MPVWHTSVSVQTREHGLLHQPRYLERVAIDSLCGVGGTTEWWFYNTPSRVGHLRVAVTLDEFAQIPPGAAVDDAGETGKRRKRTR
jgi:hypothetical protein